MPRNQKTTQPLAQALAEYMTAAEAAARLGVSVTTLGRWVEAKKVEPHFVLDRIVYRRDAVDALAKEMGR